MNSESKKKGLIVAAIAVAVVLLGGVVFLSLPKETSVVELKVTPLAATVEIDGQTYKPSERIKLRPGKHTANITMDGFQAKTIEFSLDDGDEYKLEAYLVDDDGGFEHYESDYNDLYYLREYYANHEDDDSVGGFIKKYDAAKAIREILPLGDHDNAMGEAYYLSYKEDNGDCPKLYCLSLEATSEAYAEMAIEAIRMNGFNPDDYTILRDVEPDVVNGPGMLLDEE